MGIFDAFLDVADGAPGRRRGGGRGPRTGHTARRSRGTPGVLHGSRQLPAPGRGRPGRRGALDLGGTRLPRRRPGARYLQGLGRAAYVAATDAEALDAFRHARRIEGIIPALETAHAVAYVLRGPSSAEPTVPSPSATGRFTIPGETEGFDPAGTRFARGDLVVVNLSGRGDKDVYEAGAKLGVLS